MPRVIRLLPILSLPVVSYVVLLLLAPHANAQSGNGTSLLSQLSAAFSPNQSVQQIQASGTATWNAGSLEDAGTVTLTASADGTSQLQLSLTTSGQRTESQTGLGSNALCTWSGSDGAPHAITPTNCWKPAGSLFPALSLQPALIPSYLGLVDLGSGSVGSSGNIYRHLQCQLFLTDQTSDIATLIAQQSVVDIGLDSSSMLPAVLSYSVLPDVGPPTPIVVEVHYSDYRSVNGVQIPFLIQRYINGSLQLQISVSTAQII